MAGLEGENLIRPELPGVSTDIAQSSLDLDLRNAIVDQVRRQNLHFTAAGRALFTGIPDASALAAAMRTSPAAIAFAARFLVLSHRLVEILYERSTLPVSRSTSGYVVAELRTLQLPEGRARDSFLDEYQRRFRIRSDLARARADFAGRTHLYEGSDLGRYFRIWQGIVETIEAIHGIERFGSNLYHEILEQRALRAIQDRYGLSIGQGSAGARISEAVTLNATQPPASAAPSGTRTTSPRSGSERAEDSAAWKQFEAQQKSGVVEWEGAFRSLGPYLTCRILLRREQPEIIRAWLLRSASPDFADLSRICADVHTARLRSEEQAPGGAFARALQSLEAELEERLYRRSTPIP